nr:MAG TPA: hypothetical protein [Caudoviricetes sp.]
MYEFLILRVKCERKFSRMCTLPLFASLTQRIE